MIFLWHFPGLNKEVIKDLVDSVEVELNESWPVSANKKWSEHSEKTDVMRGHSLCPLRWKRHFQISLQLHRKVSTVRSSWVLFYCSFGLICATKSPSWTSFSDVLFQNPLAEWRRHKRNYQFFLFLDSGFRYPGGGVLHIMRNKVANREDLL